MIWHYNLCGGDGPLIRDCVIYDTTDLDNGQAMCSVTGANGTCLQDPASAGAVADFVGVLHEDPASVATALSSGTLYFGKVILNPDAVYEATYDAATANDINATAGATTTVTVGASDDHLDGGWVYFKNPRSSINRIFFLLAVSASIWVLSSFLENQSLTPYLTLKKQSLF